MKGRQGSRRRWRTQTTVEGFGRMPKRGESKRHQAAVRIFPREPAALRRRPRGNDPTPAKARRTMIAGPFGPPERLRRTAARVEAASDRQIRSSQSVTSHPGWQSPNRSRVARARVEPGSDSGLHLRLEQTRRVCGPDGPSPCGSSRRNPPLQAGSAESLSGAPFTFVKGLRHRPRFSEGRPYLPSCPRIAPPCSSVVWTST